MILVERLLYRLDQGLNKLSSNQHQQLQLEDKLIALNAGQIALIKSKISVNNIHRLGLDGFKKRYQDLQFLIENPEDHKLTPKLSDKYLNKYIVEVGDLTPKFMFYIDSYVIADKGDCKNRVLYCNGELVKHADINILLQNSNWKPSFEYQETFVDISSDEVHIYSDGTFAPKELYLSYVRYPKEIDYEGYIKFDGSASITQNCELEDYLEDELLNEAMLSLALATENQFAAEAAKIKKTTEE